MSLFNKELEHDANIRLRPLPDAPEYYVYFPFAYLHGGKSYRASSVDFKKLRKTPWASYSFYATPTLIMIALALFIGRGLWFMVIPAGLIGVYLGHKLYNMHHRQMLAMVQKLEPLPYILTRRRYETEMALQTKKVFLFAQLFFWLGLLFFIFVTLGNVVHGGLIPLIYFAGLAVGMIKIGHTWKFIRLKMGASGNELNSIEGL